MGSVLQAHCKTCQQTDMVLLGVGFADSDGKRYLWPFQCKSCKHVVTANGLAKHPRCPDCYSRRIIPIYADFFKAHKPFTDTCDADDAIVAQKHNCLHCGLRTLTFSNAGCWD